jgi:3-deoxy-7-phosphoheptulonate synthase
MAIFAFCETDMIFETIPSPIEAKKAFPLSVKGLAFIEKSRKIARAIVEGKDPRCAVIVGPCSIHDFGSAIEYAALLKTLEEKVNEQFFVVMRVFVEKPRTKIGWKGFLYDPFLDGSNKTDQGILLTRKLLVKLAEMGVPAATEFVDPLFAPYIEDLVTWGFVGARTSASQPHRQMASGLNFPIGFKNQVDGNTDLAIDGIWSARTRHTHISINPEGRVAKTLTRGNPHAHLVLRGSDQKSNFDPISVQGVQLKMFQQKMEGRILIDCSHGNSQKRAELQPVSFSSVIKQIRAGNSGIMGLMLESFLENGRQSLDGSSENLLYGTSITDSCLGWKETEELVLSTEMSSVHN